jgi:plasmid stabilization system protein ParE
LTRLNIQPEASAEAYEAVAWYEGQRAGLGLEFILELDAALERATDSPHLYATQYRNARRVLLRRFPYAVYFVYGSNVVEVFAILHQHGDPSNWRGRLS